MAEYHVQRTTVAERVAIRRFATWAVGVTLVGAVLLVAFMLAARWWLPLIPFAEEKRLIDRYIGHVVSRMQPAEPPLAAFVEGLAGRLAARLEAPQGFSVTVHVVDGPTVNAFATLGGHVFVFTGLLRALQSENALAMVLGHELAHAAQRDPLVSTGRALLLSLLLGAAANQGGGGVANLGGELALLGYSRAQEAAADATAQQLLQSVYGHVGGATAFFAAMRDTHGDMADAPRWLASHPGLGERIAALEAQASAAGWGSGEVRPYPADVAGRLGED